MAANCFGRALAVRWSLLFFAFLGCAPAALGAGGSLKTIFNGRNLDGWKNVGGAVFEVQDGVIVGRTGDGSFGWLCTDRTYGDFILELEVNINSGNSGVQIRSHLPDGRTMVGYQIEVDSSARAWSGGLYEQGRRGWLQNLTNRPAARAAFKVGEWNKYRIECVGDSIQSWVNGVPAADYRDSMDLEGLIALQVHSGTNCQVRFRNLRLQDLGRHVWKPLWDGKTFAGWHIIGKGNWNIEDGAIHATHPRAEREFGHLVSDRTFSDFTVRLQYKAIQGNSGLYFRVDETGATGVSGFQAEIDATKDAGGLYETNGRAWVRKPSPEDVKKWFRPQAWNTMTVSAHGRRIAVDVNGHRTAELRDDPGRLAGHLALQLHGNMDCEMWFKDIEILQPAH
jgi:hypothetical protein